MRKILVFTKNWLGDVLCQLSAIEAIHQRYPEAEIVCAAPGRCHEILQAHPAVSRVIGFDEKKENRSLFSKIKFLLELRKESWDQAYLFHRSRTRASLALLGGAKERIGYGHGRGFLLTRPLPEPKKPMHQTDYYLHLVREAGISVRANTSYRLDIPQEARMSAAALLKDHHLNAGSFACFHLGANWAPKRWPVSHFAELAERIHKRWEIPVVVSGGLNDLPLAHELLKRVHAARLISLAGKTSLQELMALYEKALFVVSGDSGPMHLASAAGTRVVALFGPTDPALTGPRGISDHVILHYVPAGYSSPWFGKNLPPEGWMCHIRPEEVIQAIERKNWIDGPGRKDAPPLFNEGLKTR